MTHDPGQFFQRYAELYMAGDAEAVADLCEVPFLAVRSGATFHLLDRQAVVEHFAGNMAAYRSVGAAAAEIAGIDLREQGTEAVLATVNWHVKAADGTILRDFSTSYQVIFADPWRILSYVNHDRVVREGS